MISFKNVAVATVVSALGAFSATAATLSIDTWSTVSSVDFLASINSAVVEDFESYAPGEVGDPFATAVGTFSTISAQGSGTTVVGTGNHLAIRNENDGVFRGGRVNTTDGGEQYLDSNDTLGIAWNASLGGAEFNRLAFSMSDATDVGATLNVIVNGIDLASLSGEANGNVKFIVVTFDDFVTSAGIELLNDKFNDGFSIDDATLAAVPLPATGLLLLAGLGGLGALRRRK